MYTPANECHALITRYYATPLDLTVVLVAPCMLAYPGLPGPWMGFKNSRNKSGEQENKEQDEWQELHQSAIGDSTVESPMMHSSWRG